MKFASPAPKRKPARIMEMTRRALENVLRVTGASSALDFGMVMFSWNYE
jgi:hypothetical protein